MIRQSGIEPVVIEYLKTPPDRARLVALIEAVGGGARVLLREKENVYGELGLGDPALGDDALIDAIVAHPVLLNRSSVTTPKGARVCRPRECSNYFSSALQYIPRLIFRSRARARRLERRCQTHLRSQLLDCNAGKSAPHNLGADVDAHSAQVPTTRADEWHPNDMSIVLRSC
jgi:arsenate reductase